MRTLPFVEVAVRVVQPFGCLSCVVVELCRGERAVLNF